MPKHHPEEIAARQLDHGLAADESRRSHASTGFDARRSKLRKIIHE